MVYAGTRSWQVCRDDLNSVVHSPLFLDRIVTVNMLATRGAEGHRYYGFALVVIFWARLQDRCHHGQRGTTD